MHQTFLLVDFENVQQLDLSKLDEAIQVVIFVGAAQKTIPIELVTDSQRLGTRVTWQRFEGSGANALDFFIACWLGRLFEKFPQSHCIILSKDKGFDPLVRHLHKSGLTCKRIDSMSALQPKTGSTPQKTIAKKPAKSSKALPAHEELNYKRVVELLKKSPDAGRPRSRKTLSTHILAMFQKKISQEEVDRIVHNLVANKLICETDNAITYTL